MAKLTNKQRDELLGVYSRLERAKAFIMEEKTSIVRKYSSGDIAITKEIGSELYLLFTAINQLQGFLERDGF